MFVFVDIADYVVTVYKIDSVIKGQRIGWKEVRG